MIKELTLIIPALNEEKAIESVLEKSFSVLAEIAGEWEVIVVSDGSTDRTAEIARRAGATVIENPANLGYGNSLKVGILRSRYELIAICDADGSYPPEELKKLAPYAESFDMVVGARSGKRFNGRGLRYIARRIQLALVRFTVGVKVPDANSGLRIFRKELALEHLDILCGRFSFTTSLTLAFMSLGRAVRFEPIHYAKREGKTHTRITRDALRSTQIIVNSILRYNPIKIFLILASLPFIWSIVCLILIVKYTLENNPEIVSSYFLSFTVAILFGVFILGVGLLAVVVQLHLFRSGSTNVPTPALEVEDPAGSSD